MGCGGASGSNRKLSSVAPAPSVYTGGCCSSSRAPSGGWVLELELPLLLPFAWLLPLLLPLGRLLPLSPLLLEDEREHTSSTRAFCSFQACRSEKSQQLNAAGGVQGGAVRNDKCQQRMVGNRWSTCPAT